MNAGLIFYFAHRTLRCQNKIEEALRFYGSGIADVKICAKKTDLSSTMARLLRTLPAVFVVGDSPESMPDCAPPLFKILHIPVGRSGEPKGVLRLNGTDKTGYLIESLNQAIVVLPDVPELLTPIIYVLPIQMLAYYTAVFMGTDVDQPRNLAKSVTVE